ncbi:MAG: ANTAR domain-containing protein [Jatrophihabitantaceae bacterium]
MAREQELATAFVDLADTLVSDYDVADLLYRLVEHSVQLLDTDEAGLLLTDQRGSLHVMASTDEQTRLLELFQLQADEGPCLDCYNSGNLVAAPDLAAMSDRWPRFTPAALSEGYAAVHALPLRLRTDVIGALNLFSTSPGALSEDDLHIAQALADVATIGLLQERAIHRSETIVEQLEGALHSRITIEQAKGVLAERGNLSMDEAFRRLRSHARTHGARLAQTAHDVITGDLHIDLLLTDPTESG